MRQTVEYGGGGQHVLSHGSNLSAGVAVLFSHSLNMKILSSTEIVAGRFLIIRVEIQNIIFNLINVYAQNQGPERITLLKLLKNKLGSVGQGECVIMVGDWNCCTDITLDRTGQELHPQSSSFLGQTVKDADLVDAWRRKHPFSQAVYLDKNNRRQGPCCPAGQILRIRSFYHQCDKLSDRPGWVHR